MNKYLVIGGSGFIGTNLIEDLLKENLTVFSVDIKPPKNISHFHLWTSLDILDLTSLVNHLNLIKPNFVIHLAAKTDTTSDNLDDYSVNTIGSKNVFTAINQCNSVKRFIFTSTQFVNQYNGTPIDDFDYSPHTVYGQSKVINEIDLRAFNLKCCWTIIRPTNIWGPYHPRYPHEFWQILSRKLYLHPNLPNITRSYGYVKNVTFQIIKIFQSDFSLVDKMTFYVGDSPIDQFQWVNAFSLLLVGQPVRLVPPSFLLFLALFGNFLSIFHIKFPITLSRFKSMTTSNDISMEKTLQSFGAPPYSLEQGVFQTVEWLKVEHPNLVKNNTRLYE